ncbi:MAG TPA: oligogalacturonate lyase family protein [Bryobacteraceae bacterium]|nr:oligogalacturonate lyase family protein [Bryobacteraceae bacterium]
MAVAGRLSGPEWKRYADPATDLDVIRLTDPTFASGMTASHLRQFTRRSDALLYWSERNGGRQAFYLDLKAGESRQLTEAEALEPATLSFSPDERALLFFDGPSLMETHLMTLRSRVLYRLPEGATRTGMTVTGDGSVAFAECVNGRSRIVRVSRQRAWPISHSDAAVDWIMARPRHAQIAFQSAGAVWLVNNDGSAKRQLRMASGQTGRTVWAPSGRTLLYLHIPDDPKQLITLRELAPDENTDKQIARTSQFASVAPNGDASVFTGASRSKASAYVLILLRVTRRELTLCEHHASDPRMVCPVFSPDSQSIFFVSDRHGKSAVYRVHVEKFVEATGDEQG